MKDFLAIDDDCLELFDDIRDGHKEGAYGIIGPMDIMKKMLFWILGEDEKADPGEIMVNTDWDEEDGPYLLDYVPGVEFNLGPFDFDMRHFEGLIYIYDKLSSSYLEYVNEDKTVPYHYERDDEKEQAVINREKAKNKEKSERSATSKSNTEIRAKEDSEEESMPGFMESYVTPSGDYVSYSFYSTDKDLVDKMAKARTDEAIFKGYKKKEK